MNDALFRETTFKVDRHMKRISKPLADNGLYNLKPDSGDSRCWSVKCAFCSFAYTSPPTQLLFAVHVFSLEDCLSRHSTEHPECPMVNESVGFAACAGSNVTFTHPDDTLRLYRPRPDELFPMPFPSEPVSGLGAVNQTNGFQCVICCVRKVNVVFLKCRHAAICSNCILHLQQATCVLCRSPVTAYKVIRLP